MGRGRSENWQFVVDVINVWSLKEWQRIFKLLH